MYQTRIKHLSVLLLTVLSVGCGGGSQGTNASTDFTISGVAAVGSAIDGGTVDAKCATGTGTAKTSSDGSYSLKVTNGAKPCLLKVVDPVTKTELHSVAEVGADKANITPVTTLVVANLLGTDPPTAFALFDQAVKDKITPTNIQAAVTRVLAVTAAFGTSADMTGVDVLKGALKAATASSLGDAADQKIDALMAALKGADKRIEDLAFEVKQLSEGKQANSLVSGFVNDDLNLMPGCPRAKGGQVRMYSIKTREFSNFNINYKTAKLRNADGTINLPITFTKNDGGVAVPCTFYVPDMGKGVEFTVAEDGIAIWSSDIDAGLSVPIRENPTLSLESLAGEYSAFAFARRSGSNEVTAFPIFINLNTSGEASAKACKILIQGKDFCYEDNSNYYGIKFSFKCTIGSKSSINCSAPGGGSVIGVLHQNAGKKSIFLSLQELKIGGEFFNGFAVLLPSVTVTTPVMGEIIPSGRYKMKGVNIDSGLIFSADSPSEQVYAVGDYNPNSWKSNIISISKNDLSEFGYREYFNFPYKGYTIKGLGSLDSSFTYRQKDSYWLYGHGWGVENTFTTPVSIDLIPGLTLSRSSVFLKSK